MTLVPEPLHPADQPRMYIGEIGVSEHWVWTPAGVYPVKGSRWTISDTTAITQQTSGVGVALAIIFFSCTCGLSLLFLMMKDTNVTGHVQVTVSGEGFQYTAMIPASLGRDVAAKVTQQVNFARSLAAMP